MFTLLVVPSLFSLLMDLKLKRQQQLQEFDQKIKLLINPEIDLEINLKTDNSANT